ncbi:hypothetical protein LINPERHAP2_LOCUS31490 [Linum perenne]
MVVRSSLFLRSGVETGKSRSPTLSAKATESRTCLPIMATH